MKLSTRGLGIGLFLLNLWGSSNSWAVSYKKCATILIPAALVGSVLGYGLSKWTHTAPPEEIAFHQEVERKPPVITLKLDLEPLLRDRWSPKIPKVREAFQDFVDSKGFKAPGAWIHPLKIVSLGKYHSVRVKEGRSQFDVYYDRFLVLKDYWDAKKERVQTFVRIVKEELDGSFKIIPVNLSFEPEVSFVTPKSLKEDDILEEISKEFPKVPNISSLLPENQKDLSPMRASLFKKVTSPTRLIPISGAMGVEEGYLAYIHFYYGREGWRMNSDSALAMGPGQVILGIVSLKPQPRLRLAKLPVWSTAQE